MRQTQQNFTAQIALKYEIFRCQAGSHAYGTSIPTSDKDERGVCIAPPQFSLGCMFTADQAKIEGEDTEIYELAKFMRLAANSNPNLIELLYVDEDNILFMDPAWKKIRAHRHLFLSKKAKHSFSGYAMAQMKRIKGHNKWIVSPQSEREPQILDFAKIIIPDPARVVLAGETCAVNDLDDRFREMCLEHGFLAKVNHTTYRIYHSPDYAKPALCPDGHNLQFLEMSDDSLQENFSCLKLLGILIVQEDTYKAAHRKWKEYWSWKKNRNKTRAQLEEKYSYDVKHAMHLFRLLKMGKEILTEGKVIVRRPDAKELLDIRNGKWDYDTMLAKAEKLDAELNDLYETCTLQDSPDREGINNLYIETVKEYWTRKELW